MASRLWFLVLGIPAVLGATVCTPEIVNEPEPDQLNSKGAAGTLHFLRQDKGNESPACLDGSPYGVYFAPSKAGSNKWTIYLQVFLLG